MAPHVCDRIVVHICALGSEGVCELNMAANFCQSAMTGKVNGNVPAERADPLVIIPVPRPPRAAQTPRTRGVPGKRKMNERKDVLKWNRIQLRKAETS